MNITLVELLLAAILVTLIIAAIPACGVNFG